MHVTDIVDNYKSFFGIEDIETSDLPNGDHATIQWGKQLLESQWISVGERLPKKGQRVLCIQDPSKTATKDPLFADFDGKFFTPPDQGERRFSSTWAHIIFWQPLPQPPKQDG